MDPIPVPPEHQSDTAALVVMSPADPSEPHARYCLREYVAELDRRFDSGFDVERSIPADDSDLRPPAGTLLVATLRGRPIGCVALKLHDGLPAEVKRMWVHESTRGLGVGRRLLSEAESIAADRGVRVLRLETNQNLVEAISLYRSAGYSEVEAFNEEAYAHHWFEKQIGPR
jgi:GNAT superfamily N-acetyltransferase